MRIKFEVEVEVEHISGKFAPRDEIAQGITEMLEGADDSEVSGVGADGDSVYAVVGWAVEEAGE